MQAFTLHHVSVISTDLVRSMKFYREVLGFKSIPRPQFKVPGAWLACGALQIHLVENPDASFRKDGKVNPNDSHFALFASDFEAAISQLQDHGYSEEAEDAKRILISRNGIAGFKQAFLIDPDNNIIEINDAA